VSDRTLIGWTDHTFNPWIGCQRVSQGCVHCYAETLTKRFGQDVFGGKSKRRRTSEQYWRGPLRWNRRAEERQQPAMVFCASEADVFEDAPGPNEWRADVWALIRRTGWLDWQLLTKRPENVARMLPDDWGSGWPNVWLGTSIEDNRVAERAAVLASTPAWVHFVSYEPAIGPGDAIPLDGVDWLICGGESGAGHRPMDLRWAHGIRARCDAAGVAFFFKQISGPRTEMGVDALGEIVREYPRSWDRRAQLELPV
jgi:protein gp37